LSSLAGRRILVTRSRSQGSELAARLEELGAETILIPTIEIVPPEDDGPLRAALGRLGEFDWMVLTSANAVEALTRYGAVAPAGLKIAAIGPATAKALEKAGFRVELMPEQYVAESLAEALLPVTQGARVLLVRAAVAREVLPETLRAGGARVTEVEAYRSVVPVGSVAALREVLAGYGLDAVTFTSASTAQNLVELLRAGGLTLPDGVVRASIGPVTSRALAELGMSATVEAKEATIPALVTALQDWFKS
jgi:uroporphyrinogen-III synthase